MFSFPVFFQALEQIEAVLRWSKEKRVEEGKDGIVEEGIFGYNFFSHSSLSRYQKLK